ncbi:PREDICTED: septin-11-like [Amphimedon queenslandica]|uniref:Septin n=1 Tax=Amphimedon queenslandica TaxID=400682 RepID=A0A1X7VMX7_AMPQE|nr:PREDICTED: septin-11-like [Amphimedon queenslandica]|eukprot:XP_019862850.1 PREDICTED: septin-11-like [Amphimedon queenslandica]
MSSYTDVHRVLGNTSRNLDLTGHVGFDSLPDQLVNKSVKKGFDFNILCIGETGIGKSTLMDSLFKEDFKDTPVSHKQPDVKLSHNTYSLREGNVRLRLTVVSTEGFGDQINKEHSNTAIVKYIDEQYESFLQEELKIKRDLVSFHDTRIHACIYFICPTGHSLKSLDLVCMKELDQKVNIIPIIAKADTIARSELEDFKKRIMDEIITNDIRIYQFPTSDESVADLNQKMNSQLPFAVIGSREEVEVGGKKVRARKYPWGTVEVENEAHCDFTKLREMLLRVNMEDLREKTHYQHYELYRKKRLEEMGFEDNTGLSEAYEQKRKEHFKEMQSKEEHMRQMFVQKVKEKEAELKLAEQKLHDEFEKLRQQHSEKKAALDERKRLQEAEIKEFNKKKAALQSQRAQSELQQLKNTPTTKKK